LITIKSNFLGMRKNRVEQNFYIRNFLKAGHLIVLPLKLMARQYNRQATLKWCFLTSVAFLMSLIPFLELICLAESIASNDLYPQAEVVWSEFRNGNYDIFYSQLSHTGWTTKIALSESNKTDMMPCLCSGASGVTWVVWTEDSGSKSDLLYVYSRDNGWTVPRKIVTGLGFNTAASVFLDQADNPWIVWAGSNGGRSDIFFSKWNGYDWEKPTRVSTPDATPDIMPLIGMDREGIPWVCWFGFDGKRYIPYASKLISGKWGDEVESPGDNLYEILVETAEKGEIANMPGFVADPEKACVYARKRGQLQSYPVRYANLKELITTNVPSRLENVIDILLAPTGDLVILCFGDSITQGVPYLNTHGDGRRLVGGYEPTLEAIFNADSRPSQVLNWGVGGEKTYEGITRINSVLSNPYADYILILEGTNDYWHIDYETTIFNLGWMIDESLDQGVTPILSTLTPDTLNPEKPIATEYNPAIRELAAQKGVTLADQYAAVIGGWPTPYADSPGDGLHPNQVGYNVMAQTWFTAIPRGPTVATGEATAVERTAAQLNGTVNPNGSTTTYRFDYGTTTAYGSSTSTASAGSGTCTLAINASVNGLTDETLYHYRLKATNSAGTVYGSDRTFTTHRPSCDKCQGDMIVLENVTYTSGTDCECVAGTSINIGPDVIIEIGAKVTFKAPSVTIDSDFFSQSGAEVVVTVP
jgi:lysophospholipase L1-like esterase